MIPRPFLLLSLVLRLLFLPFVILLLLLHSLPLLLATGALFFPTFFVSFSVFSLSAAASLCFARRLYVLWWPQASCHDHQMSCHVRSVYSFSVLLPIFILFLVCILPLFCCPPQKLITVPGILPLCFWCRGLSCDRNSSTLRKGCCWPPPGDL